MAQAAKQIFLFDVDNTMLDNDAVQADMGAHLTEFYGDQVRDRYWAIFEEIRSELGYADYLGALERYRLEAMHDPTILRMANWLVDYPFPDRLYPNVIETVRLIGAKGPTVILSDGDAVFQPRKIWRSGLWTAFEERVLIYVHKEQMLDDVERFYPAAHYVMIDDKLRILTAMKHIWGDRLTTVFVRQGHYATDKVALATFPPADVAIDAIADLRHCDFG
jgi:FMN phosphatase YigB (HAD superfamily)